MNFQSAKKTKSSKKKLKRVVTSKNLHNDNFSKILYYNQMNNNLKINDLYFDQQKKIHKPKSKSIKSIFKKRI